MRRVALTLLAAAAIAGCGSAAKISGPGSAQVVTTIKTYLAAFIRGDGATACGLMTDQERQTLTAAAKKIGISSCADALNQTVKTLTAAQRQKLSGITVTAVHVNAAGDQATVDLKGGDKSSTLQKVDGRWLISGGVG